MIVRITLKDPDGVEDSIRDAASDSLIHSGLEKEEQEAILEIRASKIQDECAKWIECSEYVTIFIDTEKGTAWVEPA